MTQLKHVVSLAHFTSKKYSANLYCILHLLIWFGLAKEGTTNG
jgi:hypothetical protein